MEHRHSQQEEGRINMNTKMTYLYRDASNYKKCNEVVVLDEFTDDDVNRIVATLQDGEYFIPENVGLECERFAEWTEDDHPYCELNEDDFELTDEAPTELWDGERWAPITIGALVERFELEGSQSGWTAIVI